MTRMKLSNIVENKRSIFDLWLLKRGVSSVDGHLGSFEIRALVSNTTVNILVHIFWCIYVHSLGEYLGAELLSHECIVDTADPRTTWGNCAGPLTCRHFSVVTPAVPRGPWRVEALVVTMDTEGQL